MKQNFVRQLKIKHHLDMPNKHVPTIHSMNLKGCIFAPGDLKINIGNEVFNQQGRSSTIFINLNENRTHYLHLAKTFYSTKIIYIIFHVEHSHIQ